MPTSKPAPVAEPAAPAFNEVEWHGHKCVGLNLPLPKSAEYLDSPEVLQIKAEVLIRMIKESQQMLMYTGAGISTSSGIRDYASNAKGSMVQQPEQRLTWDFIESLQPTPSHRVVAALEKAGHVKYWVQQNHDGLAQKAGFPHEKINEIRGSWYDETNPVMLQREDLFQEMLQWEMRTDFVLALGTSLSGMNADRCALSCARRFMNTGKGQGTAIVSIQKTTMDEIASLRVFSKLDDFMLIVAEKMKLTLDTKTYDAHPPKELQEKRKRALEALKKACDD